MGFSLGTSNLSPSDTTHTYLPFYCHCHCHRHRHHHRRRRQLTLRLLTNFCYQSRQSLRSALGIWIQEPSASRIPSKGLRLNPHPHLRLRLPVDVDTDGIVVVVVVVTSHFPTKMVSLSLTPFHIPSPSLPFHPSILQILPSVHPAIHQINSYTMLARKSQSHETPPESRRSSLRRLSSIASLQSLMHQFNRRRSNNTSTNPEHSPSTATSILSLSSIAANAPDRKRDGNKSEFSGESDGFDHAPPVPATLPTRRGSYICLPDDPIGGMPRSRTFSNLPLPSRAKKSAASKLQLSKSHARLPLHTNDEVPPSRLPTPTFNLRKQSTSNRLVPVDDKTRKKLVRSDTVPLLQNGLQREPSVPRMTAFKENISLSPIKPLTPYDENLFACSSRQGWSEDSERDVAVFTERKASLANQKRLDVSHSGPNSMRMTQKSDSSPAYRSTKERAPTPGKPVQRWNSQPVLTNTTNVRNSYGAAIKQTRLMSARQAPTPPPASSPSTEVLLKATRTTRGFSNSSGHARLSSSQTSVVVQERPQRTSRARAESVKLKPGAVGHFPAVPSPHMLIYCQVLTAQPSAYWTGRFSSLNDRFRNEELAATDMSSEHVSKSHTDKIHTSEANSLRMRRAVEQLFSLCATVEAEQSFFMWQKAVAKALALPELAKPLESNWSSSEVRTCALEMSLRGDEYTPSPPAPSEMRKTKFMDRLLGRRQKMGHVSDRAHVVAPVEAAVVGGFF